MDNSIYLSQIYLACRPRTPCEPARTERGTHDPHLVLATVSITVVIWTLRSVWPDIVGTSARGQQTGRKKKMSPEERRRVRGGREVAHTLRDLSGGRAQAKPALAYARRSTGPAARLLPAHASPSWPLSRPRTSS